MVAGTIEADERADVERHLGECAFCRRDLEDALAWKGTLAAIPEAPKKRAGLSILLIGIGLAAIIGFVWWKWG